MKVKSENEITQSCPTLSDPMDCSLPGSSVHGIFPGKSTGVGCHCCLQRIHRRTVKKDLHNPDNHDGVITDLEPDILECEVKWALEASLRTKLVEVMEFQWSYFKSWKMILWKCCTQYASKFGKLSSGHRTGKGQFSFQSQRKAMPKNAKLPHNCTHLTC